MINKIRSLFQSKKSMISNENENTEIVFVLKEEGRVEVKLYAQDNHPDTAKKLGEFLFYLNHGYYANTIIKTVQSIYINETDQNEKSLKELFAANIMQAWLASLDIFDNIKNKPIISPTNFYKTYK